MDRGGAAGERHRGHANARRELLLERSNVGADGAQPIRRERFANEVLLTPAHVRD